MQFKLAVSLAFINFKSQSKFNFPFKEIIQSKFGNVSVEMLRPTVWDKERDVARARLAESAGLSGASYHKRSAAATGSLSTKSVKASLTFLSNICAAEHSPISHLISHHVHSYQYSTHFSAPHTPRQYKVNPRSHEHWSRLFPECFTSLEISNMWLEMITADNMKIVGCEIYLLCHVTTRGQDHKKYL